MRSIRSLIMVLLAGLVGAGSIYAQDVATVGSVTTTGTNVTVPFYVRDVAGTTLGMDQAAGSRVQGLSFRVTYSPASAVSSVTFTRAGITANLTPMFETTVPSGNTISYIGSFNESTSAIQFNQSAPAPGDQVLQLGFTLSAAATPGTVISLTIDSSPSVTLLSNQSGSTTESTSNGQLALVDGSITVASQAPVVSSVTPGSGPTTGGTLVAIGGSGFQTGAAVSFGGVPATGVSVTGPSLISATTPAHAAGAVAVSVTNPDSQSGSLSNGFTFTAVGSASADIAISKTDSADPVVVGTSFDYTLIVSNSGPDSATSVSVSDTLPAGVSFVSATPTQGSYTFDGNTLSWSAGALVNGASATLNMTVTAGAAGEAVNTATAGGAESDPNTANNSATATTTIETGGGGGPDLTALWQRVKRKKNTLSARASVSNIGTATAGASVARVYVSSNSTLDAGDKLINTSTVSSIAPGTSAKTLKLKYKSRTPIAGKFLIIVSDAANAVVESNEGNNVVAKLIP